MIDKPKAELNGTTGLTWGTIWKIAGAVLIPMMVTGIPAFGAIIIQVFLIGQSLESHCTYSEKQEVKQDAAIGDNRASIVVHGERITKLEPRP